jgi:hypothetical protein
MVRLLCATCCRTLGLKTGRLYSHTTAVKDFTLQRHENTRLHYSCPIKTSNNKKDAQLITQLIDGSNNVGSVYTGTGDGLDGRGSVPV